MATAMNWARIRDSRKTTEFSERSTGIGWGTRRHARFMTLAVHKGEQLGPAAGFGLQSAPVIF